MKRVKGWEHKLEQLFNARLRTPFEWGTNDCCIFVADSVRSITEVDISEWFRGRYQGRTKAFRLLKEFARGSVAETMDRITTKYGMKEADPGSLLPGDVVTMKVIPLDPVAGRLAKGVTVGVQSFTKGAILSPGKDGLVLSIQPYIHKAWTL
tara:strand:+ start:349 stop:804 length:456 start_codon:yes stop_codon:yes gene_type:complete